MEELHIFREAKIEIKNKGQTLSAIMRFLTSFANTQLRRNTPVPLRTQEATPVHTNISYSNVGLQLVCTVT